MWLRQKPVEYYPDSDVFCADLIWHPDHPAKIFHGRIDLMNPHLVMKIIHGGSGCFLPRIKYVKISLPTRSRVSATATLDPRPPRPRLTTAFLSAQKMDKDIVAMVFTSFDPLASGQKKNPGNQGRQFTIPVLLRRH
jgi:hypothetical protein